MNNHRCDFSRRTYTDLASGESFVTLALVTEPGQASVDPHGFCLDRSGPDHLLPGDRFHLSGSFRYQALTGPAQREGHSMCRASWA